MVGLQASSALSWSQGQQGIQHLAQWVTEIAKWMSGWDGEGGKKGLNAHLLSAGLIMNLVMPGKGGNQKDLNEMS